MDLTSFINPSTIKNLLLYSLIIYVILQIVARITPTKKDDKIVSVFGKVLNFIFNKTNIIDSKLDFLKQYVLESALQDVFEGKPGLQREIEEQSELHAKRVAGLVCINNERTLATVIEGNDKFIKNNKPGKIIKDLIPAASLMLEGCQRKKEFKIIANRIKRKIS